MQKLTNEFKIEFTKGDTYALAIKFKNITEDLRLAYFSVKDNPDDAPLIQKSLGAGIDKIDDRDYKNEKTYKFQLQPADTVNLEAQTQYLYDIQVTIGNVVKTVLHGVFILRNTISGTTSVTASNLEIEVDDEVETELLATTPATNGVEYEQDPVACAKIGDLTLLATTVKDTLVQAINEVNQATGKNADDLYKIKNGTLIVPKAKNAESAGDTTKINGILATEIFEEDGKVVKYATSAGKSANVYAKIGGHLINDIFEEDGTTVKNATNANMLAVSEATWGRLDKTYGYIETSVSEAGLYLALINLGFPDRYEHYVGFIYIGKLNRKCLGIVPNDDLELLYVANTGVRCYVDSGTGCSSANLSLFKLINSQE